MVCARYRPELFRLVGCLENSLALREWHDLVSIAVYEQQWRMYA